MEHQRVFVRVVGFTDVERHALNTVFRLSESRSPSYVPWLEGHSDQPDVPEIALVDGDSAEAILSYLRDSPAGQRLIWIGGNPPAHAWRVLSRPIAWSVLLNELDGIFAAHLADSGFLDLDISEPAPLEAGSTSPAPHRSLLVGPEGRDLQFLWNWLQSQGLPAVDLAQTTDDALALVNRQHYVVAILDMDAPQVDAWSLARMIRSRQPQMRVVGMSEHAGPLAAWWRRRRLYRHVGRSAMDGLLARPVEVSQLADVLRLGQVLHG
jgi:CheY-like chemotaxis protein